MNKCQIYLVCSVLALFLSCEEKIHYDFSIRNINNAVLPEVKFKFDKDKGRKIYEYSLNMEENSYLDVKSGVFYSGGSITSMGGVWTKTELSPTFHDIPLGGTIELYVYNRAHVEKVNTGTFILTPEGNEVEAYFLQVICEDGKIARIVSKDNKLELSDTISDSEILGSLENITDDITVIESLPKRFQDGLFAELEEAGGFIGGYIVKNKVTGNNIWLK